MKTRILLFSIMLLISSIARSQEDTASLKRGTIYPGYIINQKGDTIHGNLLNSNLWYNQSFVYFYQDTSNREKREKYRAKEIKGYRVGNRVYESFKHPGTYSTHAYNFFLRKLTGPINYYVWYYDPDRGNLADIDITLADISSALLFQESELWTQEVVKKGDDDPVDVNAIGFAKTMSSLVEDDPELVKKIKSKEEGYKLIDAEHIVKEYNSFKTSGK